MNVFAKFDAIPCMILQDSKETKRYGHTVGRSFVRTDGRTDNVKTVYPPTSIVCGGINRGGGKGNVQIICFSFFTFFTNKNIRARVL